MAIKEMSENNLEMSPGGGTVGGKGATGPSVPIIEKEKKSLIPSK